MKPRNPEWEHKVFKDDNGNPYEGERCISEYHEESATGFLDTRVWYHKGKLTGFPAIIYPDGLSEKWEDGRFIGIIELPYHQR